MTRKIPLMLVLVILLSFCFSAVGVFAAEEEAGVRNIMIPPADRVYMEEVWSKMGVDGEYLKMELKENSRNLSSDTRLLVYDKQRGELEFRIGNFQSATDKSRLRAMETFVSTLQESRVSAQTQQNIIDSMSAMDRDVSVMLLPMVMESTKADVYTAMKWISPLLEIVRVIFGLGAIVISIFLIASTILDLVFIGLPFARERVLDKSQEKGKTKPLFISTDAMSVVQEVESSLNSAGSYKNAYLLYFKRRFLTYIILSICLLYLVLGELSGFISWLLKLGSGVL
jgi:hypothetical protein